jgi:hypothetical protein
MYITSAVDLPEQVMNAHADGKLVFFVGAGASVGSPSNLPTFDGLARKLARLAAHPFSKRGGLDYFIGRLESLPGGFDAHKHTRDLIGTPKSTFNPMHRVVVDLAGAKGTFRVVTTNFDDHIAAAAEDSNVVVGDVWYGPALPLGRSFAGLVHLHGSVKRPPGELILTDRDFGRAYMTDAWAARFLLPMFDEFTVVFVGYSHDDVIMRYLALGLPSRGSEASNTRFVFTDAPGDPKWDYLDITPIGYTRVGRDHSSLVAAFAAWSERVRMGRLEHRNRIREIVRAGTTLTPVDRDYIAARLSLAEGALEFAQACASLDTDLLVSWLLWVEALPHFRALFLAQDTSQPSAILANWFCRTFIASPALNGVALQTVLRIGSSFSQTLFRDAVVAADALSRADSGAGTPWKAYLATSVRPSLGAGSGYSALSYHLDDNVEPISVVRAALRPSLQLKRRWSIDGSEDGIVAPDADLRLGIDDADTLTHHLERLVETRAAGDEALGTLLEDALSASYDLLEAYHGMRDWDELSSGRSSIAPHSQDTFRRPADPLIDALREYGEKSLAAKPTLPSRWWELSRSTFRRLSLYLVHSDPALSPDQKLEWLLARRALYDSDLKHEVFQLLASAVGSASSETRDRLLAAALDGPSYVNAGPDAGRHQQYAIFNLLVWLTQNAPTWAEGLKALETLERDNPTFQSREHPDFNRWVSSGSWGGKLPMAPEDFVQRFVEAPESTFDELMALDYTERDFDQAGWHDAMSLIAQAVAIRPSIGEPLWALTDDNSLIDDRESGVREAIIDGWADSDLGPLAEPAMGRLRAHVEDASLSVSIARFLLKQILKLIDQKENAFLAAMRDLARQLWDTQSPGYVHSVDIDPVSVAPLYLNSWPGDLARYWMSEVDRRWRQNRDTWDGLSEEETVAFSALLTGSRDALDAIEPALAREAYFMFSADPEFAATNVLPLFVAPESSRLAWVAYFSRGRYDDRMLDAGFLAATITEWDRLDELGRNGLERSFFGHTLSILSFAGVAARSRKALLDKSVIAKDGAYVIAFAEAVVGFLRVGEINGSEVWRRWLGRHVANRLSGIPRNTSSEEIATWADIVPYVGEFFPDALKLFSSHDVRLSPHFLNPEFPAGVIETRGAALVDFYAERVRRSKPEDSMTAYRLQALLETLTSELGEAAIQPLKLAAREAGFFGERV